MRRKQRKTSEIMANCPREKIVCVNLNRKVFVMICTIETEAELRLPIHAFLFALCSLFRWLSINVK